MALASISNLIKDDIQAIDRFIISQLESNIPLIRQMIEYILTCGGKRIRPMVLLLSARALEHKAHKHIDLAAVIELIHTATLLHDDVVDGSTLRRGHKTANIIWGNDASVLVGDFLYSRAFKVVVDLHHEAILDIFATATHYIAEGEILQLTNCNNPDTAEEFYFEIIKRKTAKLFEIAAEIGALLSSEKDHEVRAMRDFGLHFGLAYQLIDDALDYSKSAEQTGKNVGQDIADGKATLPLIYAMRTSTNKSEINILREAIKTGSAKNLTQILSIIESTNAIKYTSDTAKHHAQQAKQALAFIHDSPYRKALEELSDFVVERDY